MENNTYKTKYQKGFSEITASEEFKQSAIERYMQAATENDTASDFADVKKQAPASRTTHQNFFSRFLFSTKRGVAAFTACILFIAAITIALPVGFWLSNNLNRLNSNMLHGASFNLTGANGLGIVRTLRNPLARTELGEVRDWMAVFDENGNIEEVIFTRYARNGEAEEITQVELPAPIVLLRTTERWTFMMFSVRDDYPKRGGTQTFISNARYGNQSFVIENATGRVFHLPTNFEGRYGSIEVYEDGVMFSFWWDIDRDDNITEGRRRFFVLDVVDNELVFNRVFGNNDSNLIDFVVDKFGQFFVATDFDAIEGKVLYYNAGLPLQEAPLAPFTGTRFGRGSDGYVYKATVLGSRHHLNRQYTIARMGEGFEEIPVEANLDVSIHFGSMQYDHGSRDTFIIRGGKLFNIFLENGQDITVANFGNGIFTEYRNMTLAGGYAIGAIGQGFDFSRISIYNGHIFYLGRFGRNYSPPRLGETSVLYHFCLLTEVETVVMDGVHWSESRRTGMFAYNGARFGVDIVPYQYFATRIYRITIEDGEPAVTLHFYIPDDIVAIDLQPLHRR